MALIAFTTILGAQNFDGLLEDQALDAQEHHSCQLLIENTSPSPIWLATTQGLPEKMTPDELEQNQAVMILPYEIGQLKSSKTFTIYERSRQSNIDYRPNLTIVQRFCDADHTDEYAIHLSDFETDQVDPSRFIVIHNLKNAEIPEGMNKLCPGGLAAEWDEDTDQWLCKIHRYSNIYEKYVDEYVPVLSYIYQWLPTWMWAEWYTKHPHFYHWYHNHPEYYSHLEQYIAPWQTKEYKKIYDSLQEDDRRELHAPESAHETVSLSEDHDNEPIGIPETSVHIKPHFEEAGDAIKETPKSEMPQLPSKRQAPKKQQLHEVISAEEIHMLKYDESNNPKEMAPAAMGKRNYDRKDKKIKKPLALINRGIITTQSGKRNISL